MGMTDKQFNGFLRLILDDIEEALEKATDEEVKKKLEKLKKNLQIMIED